MPFRDWQIRITDIRREVKTQAAKRWVEVVNAEGSHRLWIYANARKLEEIAKEIEAAAEITVAGC